MESGCSRWNGMANYATVLSLQGSIGNAGWYWYLEFRSNCCRHLHQKVFMVLHGVCCLSMALQPGILGNLGLLVHHAERAKCLTRWVYVHYSNLIWELLCIKEVQVHVNTLLFQRQRSKGFKLILNFICPISEVRSAISVYRVQFNELVLHRCLSSWCCSVGGGQHDIVSTGLLAVIWNGCCITSDTLTV